VNVHAPVSAATHTRFSFTTHTVPLPRVLWTSRWFTTFPARWLRTLLSPLDFTLHTGRTVGSMPVYTPPLPRYRTPHSRAALVRCLSLFSRTFAFTGSPFHPVRGFHAWFTPRFTRHGLPCVPVTSLRGHSPFIHGFGFSGTTPARGSGYAHHARHIVQSTPHPARPFSATNRLGRSFHCTSVLTCVFWLPRLPGTPRSLPLCTTPHAGSHTCTFTVCPRTHGCPSRLRTLGTTAHAHVCGLHRTHADILRTFGCRVYTHTVSVCAHHCTAMPPRRHHTPACYCLHTLTPHTVCHTLDVYITSFTHFAGHTWFGHWFTLHPDHTVPVVFLFTFAFVPAPYAYDHVVLVAFRLVSHVAFYLRFPTFRFPGLFHSPSCPFTPHSSLHVSPHTGYLHGWFALHVGAFRFGSFHISVSTFTHTLPFYLIFHVTLLLRVPLDCSASVEFLR